MDNDSGDENQAQDGDDDDLNPQKLIADDYFNEILQKTFATIKTLQKEQNYVAADDVQRLISICQNLRLALIEQQVENARMQTEVKIAVGKVSGAFAISQKDQDTIQKLKDEIECAWKRTDAAEIREQLIQHELEQLNLRVEQLQLKASKAGKHVDVDVVLAKHADSMLRERDRLVIEVNELKRTTEIQQSTIEEFERKQIDLDNKNKEFCKLLDDTSSDAFKDKRLIDQLRNDIMQLNAEKDAANVNIQSYRVQNESLLANNMQLKFKHSAVKTNLEKINNLQTLTQAKYLKASAEYEALLVLKEKIQLELDQLKNLLKLKESDSNSLAKENSKMIKENNGLHKRIMTLENIKGTQNGEIKKINNTLVNLQKECDINLKSFSDMKKNADDMLRERDLERKKSLKQEVSKQLEVIALHEKHIKTLDQEIKAHIQEEHSLQSETKKIIKDRNKAIEGGIILEEKLEELQDEMLIKSNQITELNENVRDLNLKIVRVEQTYETTLRECHTLQRDLKSVTEHKDDLKNRLNIVTEKNHHLKEDLDNKMTELNHALRTVNKLEKERTLLKIENQHYCVTLQHTRTELKEKKMENERLYKQISEDEAQIKKLTLELDGCHKKKDIINNQLTQKLEEIGLLNEKIEIMQIALNRGESQYNKRLDDIRLLKIEISNLVSQRNLLTRGLTNTADMRQEVLQLNRVLTQERVRARALEQELVSSMNVHRWRKLSGKDPDKMELIMKIQSLQKRILNQTVQATEREQELEEQQKLYLSLKQFMVKLPNHTVKEKLNATKRALTAKTRKLRALSAEITSNENEFKTKDGEIELFKAQLLELKQDLLKEKKAKHKFQDELRAIKSDMDTSHFYQVNDDDHTQTLRGIMSEPALRRSIQIGAELKISMCQIQYARKIIYTKIADVAFVLRCSN